MGKYQCTVCGWIFDEEKEGYPFSELKECPLCKAGPDRFEIFKEESEETSDDDGESDIAYDKATARTDEKMRYMKEIHMMAQSGKSIDSAMATQMPMPSWDDVLILGAQLNPCPLDDDAFVDLKTVIGKSARKPMELDMPVYISHMSFGALSKEAKTALSMASAELKTAMCSGEGGILPEERNAAYKYIFEYIPNEYSVTDENLKNADAIEIKIGQGTNPGMGGHLPGDKVTPEIAKIRGRNPGDDIQSPSRFPGITTKEDLKELVERLRSRSEGRPIGIKIAAGRIERDLEYCVYAGCDFVTIDGRGGATGSSPFFLKEASTVPTLYALSRARRYLDCANADIDLVITGGLRVSSDFVKAIAMGADAVAVATAPLMALGCQQYRICGSGNCPVGIATQDEELRKRLDVNVGAKRVSNYLKVCREEMKTFARVIGKKNIHDINYDDIVTTSREISEFTDIKHC